MLHINRKLTRGLAATLLLAGAFLLFMKLAWGIKLIIFQRWRGLGLGLITSLPLGFMILVGVCGGRI